MTNDQRRGMSPLAWWGLLMLQSILHCSMSTLVSISESKCHNLRFRFLFSRKPIRRRRACGSGTHNQYSPLLKPVK